MRSCLGRLVPALLAASCSGSGEAEKPWHQIDLCLERPVKVEPAPTRDRPLVLPMETLQGRAFRALRMLPGQEALWQLELASAPVLSFRPAPRGGPCTYAVEVLDRDGRPRTVHRRLYRPSGDNAHEEVQIDLTAFERSAVRLVVRTEAGGPGGCRAAFWLSPSILERRRAPRRARADRPNILLLGIDTLRADALGAYGRRPTVTPAIDRLAEESDVFLNAFTSINNTNPSFVSLMTGLYPKNHGVYDLKTPLPEAATTIAEHLREAGYDTRAAVSAHHLGATAGLGQGFDELVRPGRQFYGETVIDQAFTWMDEIGRPFFIWLHLFDPHVPHTPPAPFNLGYRAWRTTGLRAVATWTEFRDAGPRDFDPRARSKGHVDLYPGEVAYVDRQIDRLLDFLQSRGLLETTVLVLVADHGETLGERGRYFDHAELHDNTTHVPLLIRWPGSTEGRRIEALVQHFDLFPTLLRVAGLTPPVQDGIDLETLSRAGGRRVVFAENANGGGWMARTPGYKLLVLEKSVRAGTYLYDLARDPGETENLAGKGHVAEAGLLAQLGRWRQAQRPHESPVALELSDDEKSQLEALGYIP